MLTTALAAAVIALLPHLAIAMLERSEGSAAAAKIELPDRLAGGWSTDGAQLVSFTPQFANPSAVAFKAYAGAAGTVGVHLAYFRGQNDDRKLVSSTNMLVGMRDDHWALPTTGSHSLTVDGQKLALRTAEILGRERGSERRSHLVVWRLYWIDGRFIAGDAQAKLAGVAARLRGRGDEGALLILYADADTIAASNAALEAFAQANLKELNALLQRTRDTR